ncbi:type I restriction-modification system subunit M N-terminal domain-containing protein [Rhizobium johnstonii]|uniref:type I restriction-modification system subunit M N-terminal domain-containing protein n=1 Tax=Rhizobium TaxID=379 RepID=UPI001FE0C6EA|nr:type I restriction-modification system subunit M N-terminal domain-containing protein [Rhizobium leguminosarum]
MNANAIVQKLWRLCTVLRKDGITYQQYVTELTYLLFLKMMAERNRETGSLPRSMRWADLVQANGLAKLELYCKTLVTLGTVSTRLGKDDALVLPPGENATPDERKRYADARPLPEMVQEIFDNASTFIREPQNLTTLVSECSCLSTADLQFSRFQKSPGDYQAICTMTSVRGFRRATSGQRSLFTSQLIQDEVQALPVLRLETLSIRDRRFGASVSSQ